ncbi:MAG TPA: F0F1 ATP synthase subunit B, partial [Gaiellaceae bacterium]|nr:F0F1 ATP synthase subunit B [Gaiellaceae bacterium]
MILLEVSPLIRPVPGLMIWTLICFAITFYVLKRFAFAPIQKTIDERRERIRSSLEEAERARAEARELLEEHRSLIGQAKSEAGEILAEARRTADAQRERVKEEAEEDRQRRLEDTRRQIEAETTRALEQIRAEVADL